MIADPRWFRDQDSESLEREVKGAWREQHPHPKPGLFQNRRQTAWWIGCLLSFTLLWATLIWALIRAENREALVESTLATVIAAPPPCWVTSTHETLRADGARLWLMICPRGTEPIQKTLQSVKAGL